VHKSVLNFVGDRAQFDDLTMLAVSHGDRSTD
jgi:serine phosphatase RsbU (regulator of sigma subunit)